MFLVCGPDQELLITSPGIILVTQRLFFLKIKTLLSWIEIGKSRAASRRAHGALF